MRLDSSQPSAGTGYELDTIAAVVIGGASLSGGVGSVSGTLFGALIIGVLRDLAGTAKAIEETGRRAVALPADVTRAEDLAEAVDLLVDGGVTCW